MGNIQVIHLASSAAWQGSTCMQRKNVCTTSCFHLQALSTSRVSDSRGIELYWFIPFQTMHFWWQQERTQIVSDNINKKERYGLNIFQNNDTSKIYPQAFCNNLFLQSNKDRSLPQQGARLIKLSVQQISNCLQTAWLLRNTENKQVLLSLMCHKM